MVKRIAKSILYKLVKLSLYTKEAKRKKRNKIKKLLIIQISALGDFIIFSPMLKYYRMLYPDYCITILVNRLALDLAQRFDKIDEVIPFDRRRFNGNLIYRRRLLKKIKKEVFDVIIYPAYSREINGDYIVKFSEAKEKIGFDGDLCNIPSEEKSRNNKHYTKLISATPDIIIETERNREFVEAFGVRTSDIIPSFIPTKDDEKEGNNILLESGLKSGIQFVAICPGASKEWKRWPLENYAHIIAWLRKERDVEVVICGAQNERYLAEKIRHIVDTPVADIIGKTTLTILAAVLKRAILYIGNDTGILHLAAAVGIPTVCIMGGGHFGRFFPYGDPNKNRIVYKQMDCFNCNWRCIYPIRKGKPVTCIERITVQELLKVVTQLI